ncbi:ABC transporter permease subunit, partial [Bacillus sp. D-CC]
STLTFRLIYLPYPLRRTKWLKWMRNISLFTLFRPKEIAEGTYNIWPVSIGLTAGAFCIFIAAIVLFRKRDLPL